MAALTDAQWQAGIIAELTADDDEECRQKTSSLLRANMSFIWAVYADKANVSAHLRYLYAKRHAIDLLLGRARAFTTGTLGPLNPMEKDKFDNLLKLREIVSGEIESAERRDPNLTRPLAGTIARTAPVMAGEGAIDQNHAIYRGDPILR
jgi:hypothetical protein